jgi:Holliday junction resolvase RusA-like endonuclease
VKAELTITGRPITKKNSQQISINRATGKRFIRQSDQYQNYETQALWQLKKYYGPKFDGAIKVKLLYWLPNRQGYPDLVGLVQASQDILQKAGIIKNDRDIVSLDGSRIAGIDKDKPRVEIEIEEVENK